MTKTTRIILIVSILVLLYGILFGCKEKPKYERSTYFLKRWDSVQYKIRTWIDTAGVLLDGNSNVEFSVADSNGSYFSLGREYYKGDTINYIRIVDSSDLVAYYENGKWDIPDCQKSLKVLIDCIKELQDQLYHKDDPPTFQSDMDKWTLDTATTYVFEGEYDYQIGTAQKNIP